MSVGSPPYLVDAVRSLLAQDESVEMALVNSGGGDPESILHAAGMEYLATRDYRRIGPGGAQQGHRDDSCARHRPDNRLYVGFYEAATGTARRNPKQGGVLKKGALKDRRKALNDEVDGSYILPAHRLANDAFEA